jgi:hypothetical protein
MSIHRVSFDSSISVSECLNDCADATEAGTAACRIADLLKLMFQFVNRQFALVYTEIAVLRNAFRVSFFVWVILLSNKLPAGVLYFYELVLLHVGRAWYSL